MNNSSAFEDLKNYLIVKNNNSKDFYNNFIKCLKINENGKDVISKRGKYLDILMNELNEVETEVAEIAFNLMHVCFPLEKEINLMMDPINENKNSEVCSEQLYTKSFDYLFFTVLYITSKLCGNSDSHKKVKTQILEKKLHFNIVLKCEILLLNFIDFNVFLYSPSEIIRKVLSYFNIPSDIYETINANIENYVNFVYSEFIIYSAYDQFVISMAICKILLSGCDNNYINIFDIIVENTSEKEKVNQCFDLINNALEDDETENFDNNIENLRISSQIVPNELCL